MPVLRGSQFSPSLASEDAVVWIASSCRVRLRLLTLLGLHLRRIIFNFDHFFDAFLIVDKSAESFSLHCCRPKVFAAEAGMVIS